MSLDKSRILAVQGLLKVESSGYSNLVLSSLINDGGLNEKEKAFTAKIFYGSIEKKITLNYILQKFITKPLKKLDKEVLAIMQSGLYQIIYMDSVPSFAAINQAVSLCPYFKKSSAKGLVNAVLRKSEKFSFENEKFKNEIERLSVVYSVSEEIIKIISKDYKEKTEDILKSFLSSHDLHININTTKISVLDYLDLLKENNIEYKKTEIENCISINHSSRITNLIGFKEGYFFVQGFESQYAVFCAEIKKEYSVLDMCAAPGGKSFAAANYLDNTGVVLSLDPNLNRLKLIEDGANRLGFTNINTEKNNGEVYNESYVNYDVVICDVPCSGIGIIAKKPDLRYKNLENINDLVKLQYEILSCAKDYIKKDGRIVYSTCTINKAENEGIINKFLEENKDFKLVKPKLIPKRSVLENDMVKFIPHFSESENKYYTEGFFVAILEKDNLKLKEFEK